MVHTMKGIRSSMLSMLFAVFALAACQYSPTAASGDVPHDAIPSQQAATTITAADIGRAQTWGGIDNVVSVKHLFFSAQPDRAALQVAREHGVGVVINLREPSEFEWDEPAEVQRLGMTYFNLPVSTEGTGLNQETMETISRLVRQHANQKILLHCSSGNRASAWFAVHLANDHGMGAEQSIALARQAGLDQLQMENRVRNYLGSSVHDNL